MKMGRPRQDAAGCPFDTANRMATLQSKAAAVLLVEHRALVSLRRDETGFGAY